MGGTLEPEETPGGGLTMNLSLPAAPALAATDGLPAVEADADGAMRRPVPGGGFTERSAGEAVPATTAGVPARADGIAAGSAGSSPRASTAR
jgi:hypothetical protein